MDTRNLIFVYNSGIYGSIEKAAFSTSILVNNCPDVESGYDFLSKILKPEFTGASHLAHVFNPQNINPLRVYDFKPGIKTFSSGTRKYFDRNSN